MIQAKRDLIIEIHVQSNVTIVNKRYNEIKF